MIPEIFSLHGTSPPISIGAILVKKCEGQRFGGGRLAEVLTERWRERKWRDGGREEGRREKKNLKQKLWLFTLFEEVCSTYNAT